MITDPTAPVGGWGNLLFPCGASFLRLRVCVIFSLPSSFHLSEVIGGQRDLMCALVNTRYFPPSNTRRSNCTISPSHTLIHRTLQGEDISILVSLPLFPSLGDRQHKNTIHPFSPFPRFSPIPPKNGSVRSRTIHYLDQVNIMASPHFMLSAPENKLKKSETSP